MEFESSEQDLVSSGSTFRVIDGNSLRWCRWCSALGSLEFVIFYEADLAASMIFGGIPDLLGCREKSFAFHTDGVSSIVDENWRSCWLSGVGIGDWLSGIWSASVGRKLISPRVRSGGLMSIKAGGRFRDGRNGRGFTVQVQCVITHVFL